MAIDTIKIFSPPLTQDQAENIMREAIKREAIDLATGEQLYSITTNELLGSYDYRIRVSLKDKEFIFNTETKCPELKNTDYYIYI